ncbi:MAG: BT_3928 family protein [Ferruginibacter sp.]
MKILITIIRIFTGILFIFSGLVKAIDPRGLAYKMQEFFEAFANDGYFKGLMHILNDYALSFSIIMITLEVIIGLALLLGWQKKFTTIMLLLLMILFTFLTSYVLFSGKIRACGCFGDCIPITPIQTFTKDILLLIFSLVLLFSRKYILPVAKPLPLLLYVSVATLLTLFLQFYVLKHLPVIDCLPFKKGNNVLELREMPKNAVQDKFDYIFVYSKDGANKEFKATELPDSTWEYVDRKQTLIEKGSNNVPLINDFNLGDEQGNDVTQTVFTNQNEYYLLFIKDFSNDSNQWLSSIKKLMKESNGKKDFYIITSQVAPVKEFIFKHGLQPTGLLSLDATALKTAARANPTLYLMQGPIVKKKWGWGDFWKIDK